MIVHCKLCDRSHNEAPSISISQETPIHSFIAEMCISPLRRGALSANLHGLSSKSEIKCHTINRSLITMFKTSTYLCSMLAPHASNYCASYPQIYIIHYSLLLYQTREQIWFLASSQWLAQSFEIHCEVLFALSVQLSIVDCLFK